MEEWEKAVCEMFGVKHDLQYISKPRLAKALAYLNADYETLHFDLYAVAPNHQRFKHFTDAQREDLQRRLSARQALRDKAKRDIKQTPGQDSGHADREVCSNVDLDRKG
jgi:hypothetical protein